MKLHKSMFPIVIKSVGVNRITFTSPECGVWEGSVRGASNKHDLEYFLSRVIGKPDQYIVESVGGHKFPIVLSTNIKQYITFSSFNQGVWEDGSTTCLNISHFFEHGEVIVSGVVKPIKPTYQECAIEDMPLGAKLLGFYNMEGDFVELTFRPKVIEVNDDCICLRMHFSNKGEGVGGEANFPRHRKIRYEK